MKLWYRDPLVCIKGYSHLSLNGHLYRTDTSLRRTPCVGPGPTSDILQWNLMTVFKTSNAVWKFGIQNIGTVLSVTTGISHYPMVYPKGKKEKKQQDNQKL